MQDTCKALARVALRDDRMNESVLVLSKLSKLNSSSLGQQAKFKSSQCRQRKAPPTTRVAPIKSGGVTIPIFLVFNSEVWLRLLDRFCAQSIRVFIQVFCNNCSESFGGFHNHPHYIDMDIASICGGLESSTIKQVTYSGFPSKCKFIVRNSSCFTW